MNDSKHHVMRAANCHYNTGVSTSGNYCYVCEPAATATPAPLDPAAVQVGDTLVWTNSGIKVSVTELTLDAVVFEWINGAQGQLLWTEVWNYLQPAPEPEAEWEPGDMAAVTARGWINGWSVRTAANDGWASHSESDDVRNDAEVESVRRLIVIDLECARALVHDHFDDDRSRALLDALLDL